MEYSATQVLEWIEVRVEIDDHDPNTPVKVHITDEDGTDIRRFERDLGWV